MSLSEEDVDMKSTLQILLVALVIGAVLAAPVAAATSQGLEWGVANADRFNFQLTAKSPTETISEGIYIDVVASPDVIPNVVDVWGDLPDWTSACSGRTALPWAGLH